ncbi:hypothetical protein [Streptomyces erythrochromogenes]|uniref:hypothetical protein n=1 Tax=Streptomyces erythrochromogenes TaxID=285574 RepID=UPI0033F08E4E
MKIWTFTFSARFRLADGSVVHESCAIGSATEGQALAVLARDDKGDGRTLIEVTRMTRIDPDDYPD